VAPRFAAVPAHLRVMRRTKLFVVLLLLALAAGAAAVVLHSRAAAPARVVRDHFLDSTQPDRRLVTLKLGNWSESCRSVGSKAEARVRGDWTGPWEAFPGGDEVVCVIPAEAEACRLPVWVQRRSPYEKANLVFERCRLANHAPKLCEWIAGRFSNKPFSAKAITVEVNLPRRPHQDPLYWTGSSRP
jgi:hypothetical protein